MYLLWQAAQIEALRSWVPSHRLVRSVTLAGLLVPAMTLGVNGEVSLMLNIHCTSTKGVKLGG